MLLKRNIYEIQSESINIIWVKCRWTIRKFCVEKNINCLLDNAEDKDNCVRFALLITEDIQNIKNLTSYILHLFDNKVNIELVLHEVENPIIWKLKNNILDRY